MQFTAVLTTIALAAISTVSAQSGTYTKFTDCAAGKPSDLAISSLTLSPSPMCLGEDYCITATGALSAPITKGAKLGVWGKYLNRIVYRDSVDLCDVLAANGQECPIPETTTELKICLKLKPDFWEGVTTQFDFIATNANDDTIFCQRALDRGLEGATC